MKTSIKTIDVIAYEWRDKVNGNTYFAGQVVVNYKLNDERTYTMPYQYGYGDHYQDIAIQTLFENNELPTKETRLWKLEEESGIIVRTFKHLDCKKSDLKQFK